MNAGFVAVLAKICCKLSRFDGMNTERFAVRPGASPRCNVDRYSIETLHAEYFLEALRVDRHVKVVHMRTK